MPLACACNNSRSPSFSYLSPVASRIYAFSVANVPVSGFRSAITILPRCQVCLSHLRPVWRGKGIMKYIVCLFYFAEIKQRMLNLSIIFRMVASVGYFVRGFFVWCSLYEKSRYKIRKIKQSRVKLVITYPPDGNY